MENIYQPPQSNVVDEKSEKSFNYKLFKVSGISLATFFGTMIAGGYLMYRNYNNLGRYAQARKTLFWSVVATVAVFIVALMIPEDVRTPNIGFTIIQVVVMQQLAKRWFDDVLREHEARGGALASNWLAFGVSLLVMFAVIAIGLGLILFATLIGISL